MGEKKGNSLQKINSLTQTSFETFCLADNICPECAQQERISDLTKKDGETVCTFCGLVVSQEKFSYVIPFGSTNKPENLLAEGKGLGGTLQRKGTFCVLAQQTGSVVDLPIRAKHTMIITSKHEHPRVATLLRLGNRRCQEWGIPDYASKPKDVMVKNVFGEMLRTIGGYYAVKGLRFNTQVIADGCFALSLKTVLGDAEFEGAKQKLCLFDGTVNQIKMLYEVLKI